MIRELRNHDIRCRSLLLGVLAALLSITGAQIVPASNASASEMPLTLSMSCAKAARLVAESRGIVLKTGEFTFDRYVNSLQFCDQGDALRPEWVPTQDNPQCFIGYTCYLPHIDSRHD